MRFKLDENFGTRTQAIFHAAGHDVQTVRDQNIQGCLDQDLYKACCKERRCLVTLDLNFSDVIRFPPASASGIVVIRVPRNPSLALLIHLVQQLLRALTRMQVEGRLWIVESGRIRIHQAETENEP